MITILEALGGAESRLKESGSPTPRLDSQVLLAHVLETERVRLYLDHDRPLTEGELRAFYRLVARRARHEPVAYLAGVREFWSLPIRVDSRVLIPRPETETILEEVAALYPGGGPAHFSDVGCGSGCLLCALAELFPEARGTGIDRDPGALAVAAENLRRLRLDSRLRLLSGNLLEPLGEERLELICANLPYIPSGELARLPECVRLYEPLCALDGGPDGLQVIRSLVAQAPHRLAAGGWLLLEIGAGQAGRVSALCREAGFAPVRARRDLSGVERVIVAKWPGV